MMDRRGHTDELQGWMGGGKDMDGQGRGDVV